MCNLSQGIVEETRVEIIMNMNENGFTLEQMALATGMSEEEVQKILDTHQPVLA
jgi:hypothetical protein